MNHLEIINYLIEKYNYKTYLEIGVATGENFKNVNIENKECCDITNKNLWEDINITYLMSSDEMFDCMPKEKKYDIIFIDGLHTENQVDRDILNSLKHLNKGGLVLCHDTLPPSYFAQLQIRTQGLWCGNVWKSIAKLNTQNIDFYTIDNEDYGLTIIKYTNDCYALNTLNDIKLNYEHVFKNINEKDILVNAYTDQGKYIMHILTIDEFLNKF